MFRGAPEGWMNISLEDHVIWPTSAYDFESSMHHEEGPLFAVYILNDGGELECIGQSDLEFNYWELSQELAEYLSTNEFQIRDCEDFNFLDSWTTRRVEYARNSYGNYVYSECTLDCRYYVIKYSRTRDAHVPRCWHFARSADGTRLSPESFGRVVDERPVRARDWNMYWGYATGIADYIYDPTDYEEWWTFVAFTRYYITEEDSEDRLIVYLSDRTPDSLADMLEMSVYSRFDTSFE
jgi:hypothetical protein